MRPTPPRPGLTLTEVLVAMFVMALGLMALLTLFPLGAMQIGQALKDDRTTQVANQADNYIRAWWQGVAPQDADRDPNRLTPDEAMFAALEDPNLLNRRLPETNIALPATMPWGVSASQRRVVVGTYTQDRLPFGANYPADMAVYNLGGDVGHSGSPAVPQDQTTGEFASATLPVTQLAAVTDPDARRPRPGQQPSASYPVLVDPFGYLSRATSNAPNERHWVGRKELFGQPAALGTPLLLPRRNPLAVANAARPFDAAYTSYTLSDDLSYQPNGGSGQKTVDPTSGVSTDQPLGRQGRYTWAAMVQRANNADPSTAKLTVLVFDGRPQQFAAPGDEVALSHNFVNSPPDPTTNEQTAATHQTRPSGVGPGMRRKYAGELEVGDRSLTLNVPIRNTDQAPLVRRGGWLAIVTLEPNRQKANPAATRWWDGVRTVSFHRVTGLTAGDETTISKSGAAADIGTKTAAVTPMVVDIDPPVQAPIDGRRTAAELEILNPATGAVTPTGTQIPLLVDPSSYKADIAAGEDASPGQVYRADQVRVYLFAGLSEVFERPALTR